MTGEENIKFFNKVKGKKIRWSTWPNEWYFIPLRCSADGHMFGTDEGGGDSSGLVSEGFSLDSMGEHWLPLPDFEEELKNL